MADYENKFVSDELRALKLREGFNGEIPTEAEKSALRLNGYHQRLCDWISHAVLDTAHKLDEQKSAAEFQDLLKQQSSALLGATDATTLNQAVTTAKNSLLAQAKKGLAKETYEHPEEKKPEHVGVLDDSIFVIDSRALDESIAACVTELKEPGYQLEHFEVLDQAIKAAEEQEKTAQTDLTAEQKTLEEKQEALELAQQNYPSPTPFSVSSQVRAAKQAFDTQKSTVRTAQKSVEDAKKSVTNAKKSKTDQENKKSFYEHKRDALTTWAALNTLNQQLSQNSAFDLLVLHRRDALLAAEFALDKLTPNASSLALLSNGAPPCPYSIADDMARLRAYTGAVSRVDDRMFTRRRRFLSSSEDGFFFQEKDSQFGFFWSGKGHATPAQARQLASAMISAGETDINFYSSNIKTLTSWAEQCISAGVAFKLSPNAYKQSGLVDEKDAAAVAPYNIIGAALRDAHGEVKVKGDTAAIYAKALSHDHFTASTAALDKFLKLILTRDGGDTLQSVILHLINNQDIKGLKVLAHLLRDNELCQGKFKSAVDSAEDHHVAAVFTALANDPALMGKWDDLSTDPKTPHSRPKILLHYFQKGLSDEVKIALMKDEGERLAKFKKGEPFQVSAPVLALLEGYARSSVQNGLTALIQQIYQEKVAEAERLGKKLTTSSGTVSDEMKLVDGREYSAGNADEQKLARHYYARKACQDTLTQIVSQTRDRITSAPAAPRSAHEPLVLIIKHAQANLNALTAQEFPAVAVAVAGAAAAVPTVAEKASMELDGHFKTSLNALKVTGLGEHVEITHGATPAHRTTPRIV